MNFYFLISSTVITCELKILLYVRIVLVVNEICFKCDQILKQLIIRFFYLVKILFNASFLLEMDITDILTSFHTALGLLILYLLYRLSTKNHNFWLDRNVKYVKPMPFVGCMKGIWTADKKSVDLERHRNYGRVYGFFEGTRPHICVADPKLLRAILVKDFEYFADRREEIYSKFPFLGQSLLVLGGEEWKRVRVLLAPSFTSYKLKRMFSSFQNCSQTLVQNLMKSSDKGTPVDVTKYFGGFAMNVITSAVMSTRMGSENEPENFLAKSANSFVYKRSSLIFRLLRFCPDFVERHFSAYITSRPILILGALIEEVMKKRKETGETKPDFLQLMLDSAGERKKKEVNGDSDNISSKSVTDSRSPSISKTIRNKRLTEEDILSTCVTFFLAGYHTTSQTLSFTAYQLALNQNVQEKVFKEISDHLEKTQGQITYEGVESLKYLDSVIFESLRLYPSIARIERMCSKDYILGDTGITIPKGMMVLIPAYVLHRDPDFFPDPLKFNPNRFNEEGKKNIEPYSFLPFGAGPRICLGMRLALMEIKVALIFMLSTFFIKTCDETEDPLEFSQGLKILRPKRINLRFEKRDLCLLNKFNKI